MDRKDSKSGSARKPGQQKDAREGFGDDMGTRVGRPDPGTPDDRSMARPSENADDRGIESGSRGGERSSMRADGSSTDTRRGETLDHTQRAESGTPERGGLSGMGGEASRGIHGAQHAESAPGAPAGAKIEKGTDEQSPDRAGSEPLRGRQSEHESGYGGEGGTPRTSSDRREGDVDYYGDEGTRKG